jgi:large subunit ribosomal protein L19e
MNYRKAKRLAAKILKVGESKVWIDPEAGERIKEAMTNEDVRGLIAEKIITKNNVPEQSRARARKLKEKKKKGRKRGKGKRTGTKKARKEGKRFWIKNVRAQRAALKELKKKGVKLKYSPRKIYMMISGNFFKGKKHLQSVVEGGKK